LISRIDRIATRPPSDTARLSGGRVFSLVAAVGLLLAFLCVLLVSHQEPVATQHRSQHGEDERVHAAVQGCVDRVTDKFDDQQPIWGQLERTTQDALTVCANQELAQLELDGRAGEWRCWTRDDLARYDGVGGCWPDNGTGYGWRAFTYAPDTY